MVIHFTAMCRGGIKKEQSPQDVLHPQTLSLNHVFGSRGEGGGGEQRRGVRRGAERSGTLLE